MHSLMSRPSSIIRKNETKHKGNLIERGTWIHQMYKPTTGKYLP